MQIIGYKQHPNHMAAFDSGGNQIGIIFETAPPAQTPLLMESLVNLPRKRLSDEGVHPLLAIADEANRHTVKKHVRQLVKNGRLVRHGKGRGTCYSPY